LPISSAGETGSQQPVTGENDAEPPGNGEREENLENFRGAELGEKGSPFKILRRENPGN
jgi:hypothetical protein